MGFWNFIRDMFVFDWLFGHSKKKSFWEQRQREIQRYSSHSSHDVYDGNDNSHFQNHYDDYVQQNFDDDLDSGMYDDL